MNTTNQELYPIRDFFTKKNLQVEASSYPSELFPIRYTFAIAWERSETPSFLRIFVI